MKTMPTLTLLFLAATAGLAAAQPTPEPVGGMPADPQPPPVDPQPPVEPPHPPQPAAATRTDAAEAPTTGRPEGIAFGVGFGYTLPASWQQPNTTSVRMRLASGLTFEPVVVLGNETAKQSMGGGETKTSTTQLSAAALLRIPVVRHGKVELEVLAGAGFGTTKTNPDGDNNNTTATNLGFTWGLAVSYWYSRHWNLTFSARNNVLSVVKTTRQMAAGDEETTTTTFEAEFAPVVSAMIHLYN